jgi:hypothetical protein
LRFQVCHLATDCGDRRNELIGVAATARKYQPDYHRIAKEKERTCGKNIHVHSLFTMMTAHLRQGRCKPI